VKHPAQELDRVPLRAVLVVVGLTVVVFGVAVLGAARAASPSSVAVPAPRDTLERSLVVVTSPGLDRNAARARDLDRYRWIDRDADIAEIPIERAIDLELEDAR
jgi:hypothetical protein